MNTEGAISLVSQVRKAANRLLADQLAKRGITGIVPSHGNILVNLYRHGPLPMNRLAALIGRKKNTLTVLVRKLEKAGFVKLAKDSRDHRMTLVELTPKGRELEGDFQEISRLALETFWGDMPPGEREALIKSLEKIKANLGGAESQTD